MSLDLAPEDNFQLAQADMLANVIGDLEGMLSAAFNEKDPDTKVTFILGLYCVLLGGSFCAKTNIGNGSQESKEKTREQGCQYEIS